MPSSHPAVLLAFSSLSLSLLLFLLTRLLSSLLLLLLVSSLASAGLFSVTFFLFPAQLQLFPVFSPCLCFPQIHPLYCSHRNLCKRHILVALPVAEEGEGPLYSWQFFFILYSQCQAQCSLDMFLGTCFLGK